MKKFVAINVGSGDAFYLEREEASILYDGGGSEKRFAKLFQNEVLGEMAFFDRKPRSATAIALTECELLEIPFDGLDKIYGQLPDYFKSIIASVVERLRKANATIRKLEDGQQNTIAMDGDLSEDEMNALLAEEPSKK